MWDDVSSIKWLKWIEVAVPKRNVNPWLRWPFGGEIMPDIPSSTWYSLKHRPKDEPNSNPKRTLWSVLDYAKKNAVSMFGFWWTTVGTRHCHTCLCHPSTSTLPAETGRFVDHFLLPGNVKDVRCEACSRIVDPFFWTKVLQFSDLQEGFQLRQQFRTVAGKGL